jgi:hypothetical protein
MDKSAGRVFEGAIAAFQLTTELETEKSVNSEKLNSWLAPGASIGVLIGLIFELGQNVEMMRVQMLDSRTQSQPDRRAQSYAGQLNRINQRFPGCADFPGRRACQ